jgi:hypothetical protein
MTRIIALNRKIISLSILSVLLAVLAAPRAGAQNSYPPQLAAFTAAKEQQELQIARERHLPMPPEVKDFFKSAHQEDYLAMSNLVNRLGTQLSGGYDRFTNGRPAWLPFWQPMTEVEAGYEPFAYSGAKYPLAFGEGIIQSVPPGSIYFGGTDSGRMLVTALCVSQAQGKPFYTLTQNALSDGEYLDYLRGMYGRQIHLPTTNDVQKKIEDYKSDALHRFQHGQLKPGEMVQNGEAQITGQVAVMAVHGLLAKWILDQNPGPDFYYEESFPLEPLYPCLSPHGLIFKLNHEPLPELSEKDMDADRAFWSKQFAMMLGGWLKTDTSVSNLCLNAEILYLEKDLSSFTGDREFLTNDFASKAFSKLRVSIAGLYQWRLMNRSGTDDAKRLSVEADYAFRQAYALCPTSPEALYRYVNFLLAQSRLDDAILLVHTTLKLTPADDHYYDQYEDLLSQLKQYREQSRPRRN